jgi:hypothetical protein
VWGRDGGEQGAEAGGVVVAVRGLPALGCLYMHNNRRVQPIHAPAPQQQHAANQPI